MIARRKCLRKKILDNSGVVCYYHTIANAKTGRSTRVRRIREGTEGESSCAAAEKVAPERQTERERVGSDGIPPLQGNRYRRAAPASGGVRERSRIRVVTRFL